ncbi:MAG TPA: dihydropteroate synthase [Geothrix sp.]|nr:dihydropteroate synthase [Geothrix sp.]
MLPFHWGPFLQDGPLFLGILNLTPDSFSDGGRFTDPEAAYQQALRLQASGARMLDVGAESTRPGAAALAPGTEWERLATLLPRLVQGLPDLPLSLDTRHAEVACLGLGAGAAVLNDVTGFSSPDMLALAQSSPCGLIAMRSRRQGADFLMPPYDDPTPRTHEAAVAELRSVRDRLRSAGIPDSRVLLDPGFGFGTSYLEDLALWQALPDLPRLLDWPADRFCIGISRKRFVATRAGAPLLSPAERDPLTAELHGEAIRWGYRVFRTHAIG